MTGRRRAGPILASMKALPLLLALLLSGCATSPSSEREPQKGAHAEGRGPVGLGLAPPAPPIVATVLAVDASKDLVLLSCGADDRVEVGFAFSITRGRTFVGRVRVIRVMPDLAGCEVEFTAPDQTIQAGDLAATRL